MQECDYSTNAELDEENEEEDVSARKRKATKRRNDDFVSAYGMFLICFTLDMCWEPA